MNGKSIAEIAAFQWAAANETIMNDLKQFNLIEWVVCDYRALVGNTSQTIKSIARFAKIKYTGELKEYAGSSLPVSKTAITLPKKDKWKRHRDVIESLVDIYEPVQHRLDELDASEMI